MTKQSQSFVEEDVQRLGELAMKFRGTHDEEERRTIAGEYRKIVESLIESERWTEVPGPEDQLPENFMPARFARYWEGRVSNTP